MDTIVSCPECGKKLKIAPASLGRKVKCVCGNIFAAQDSERAQPHAVAVSSAPADVLVVACESCQTKLKVPASAKGRKMKCTKCGSVFVAGGASTPVPAKSAAPFPFRDDDDEGPRPWKSTPPRPPLLDDEDETARPPKRLQRADDSSDEHPALTNPVPARKGTLLNVLVLLIIFGYLAAFVPTYLGYLDAFFPEPARAAPGGMIPPPLPPPPIPDGLPPPELEAPAV